MLPEPKGCQVIVIVLVHVATVHVKPVGKVIETKDNCDGYTSVIVHPDTICVPLFPYANA